MARQRRAVGEMVTPDREIIGVFGSEPRSGEGLDPDKPLIGALQWRGHRPEIERTLIQPAAMALVQLEIAKHRKRLAQRLGRTALLDRHVVGIQMQPHVGVIDEREIGHRLIDSVQKRGLVAVDQLDAEPNPRLLRCFRNLMDHLGAVTRGIRRRQAARMAEAAIEDAIDLLDADLGRAGDNAVKTLFAAAALLGVAGRDVRVRGQSSRTKRDNSRGAEAGSEFAAAQLRQDPQGDGQCVEPGLADRLQNPRHRIRLRVGRPYPGMDRCSDHRHSLSGFVRQQSCKM